MRKSQCGLLRPVLMLAFLTSVSAVAEQSEAPLNRKGRFTITEEPGFPSALAMRGVTAGSASFMLLVGSDGELRDFLLLEATHLEIGMAVAKVLPAWKYLPVEVDGIAVNAASRITVKVRSSGSVAALSVSDDVQNLFPDRKIVGQTHQAYQVATLDDLDYMPALVRIVQPPSPPKGSIQDGPVTVVFRMFIDQEGRVRIPILQEAGNGQVDLAVLEDLQQTLLQWRFTPPRMEGQVVVAQVQQPFELSAAADSPPVAPET